MRGKVVVCRCEDVTLDDVEHSLELGYADIEEVKRYTGFGTGPCQGKVCQCVVALLLAARTGAPARGIQPFTSRPPIAPIPLKLLARDPAACYPMSELSLAAAPTDAASAPARRRRE
jgi:sarcosine oxidase subunit beta